MEDTSFCHLKWKLHNRMRPTWLQQLCREHIITYLLIGHVGLCLLQILLQSNDQVAGFHTSPADCVLLYKVLLCSDYQYIGSVTRGWQESKSLQCIHGFKASDHSCNSLQKSLIQINQVLPQQGFRPCIHWPLWAVKAYEQPHACPPGGVTPPVTSTSPIHLWAVHLAYWNH